MNVSTWFFRLAVVYLVTGVALGIAMAASHNHSLFPVHAHINLLGWVTLGLFGIFYRLWPKAATTKLARVHFWMYVPAHLVMMVTLAMLYLGMPEVEPILALSSMVVGLAILCFAAIVWTYTPAGQDQPLVDAEPAQRAA